jgi:hypothetical protein
MHIFIKHLEVGFFLNTNVQFWIYVIVFLLIFNRWLNPLFKIGHKRRLEEDDMYSVLPQDRSKHLGEELQG